MNIPIEEFNPPTTYDVVVNILAENAGHDSVINYDISALYFDNASIATKIEKLEKKMYTLSDLSAIEVVKKEISKLQQKISENNILIKNKRHERWSR